MWTRRKLFPTLEVPATPHPAAVTTPHFTLQQQQQQQGGSAVDFTLDEGTFNFVASLSYTLVPALSPQEASQLLAWAFPRAWCGDTTPSSASSSPIAEPAVAASLAALLRSPAVLEACSQVEYFFFGTDNGQVFLMPLLPPHLLELMLAETADSHLLPGLEQQCQREAQLRHAASQRKSHGSQSGDNSEWAGQAMLQCVPVNCVGRRLLHRHMREEPVTATDHLGVLFASASSCGEDRAVALSMFHPVPAGVVCLSHPTPVRSLKLWEGAVFTATAAEDTAETMDTAEASPSRSQRAAWRSHLADVEPVAVYLFTGDDKAVVRLWRVDVVARTYTLQHVLVCSGNMTGMLSPLSPFTREDVSRRVPSRASDCVLHCLDVDVPGNRLFAGTEGGVYVWALDGLSWCGPQTHSSSRTAAAWRHPLCWDTAQHAPLPCALQSWAASRASSTSPSDDAAGARETADDAASSPQSPASLTGTDGTGVVAYRAARLVNHHVWIAEAAAVQPEMSQAQARLGDAAVSGWKPKYGRVLTGGAAVGVVSNAVLLSDGTDGAKAAAVAKEGDGKSLVCCDALSLRLTCSVVTVAFDGGEVKNDLRVPLSCVVPVVYPAAFLRTPGTAAFAVRVLAPRRRVLTSCADGKVCVWACTPPLDKDAAETYVPQLVTQSRQEHRGLGRHVCVLRSPDIFVSCSFDEGLVKEWHVYDEPEVLLRCARRFTLVPYTAKSTAGGGGAGGELKGLTEMFKKMATTGQEGAAASNTTADDKGGEEKSDEDNEEDVLKAAEGGDVVAGIACAAAYPAFGALFLVGAFESAIQTYSLSEVTGCEPPRNYIYNGHKTVRLPSSMAEDVYHELE